MSNKIQSTNKMVEKNEDFINVLIHPLKTLYFFAIIIPIYTKKYLSFLFKNIVLFTIIGVALIVPNFMEGPHSEYFNKAKQIGYFCLFWIFLGFASSMSIGTGFHTFALYLSPTMASITKRAYSCNALPVFIPSKWDTYQLFAPCPANVEKPIEFLDILLSLQFEAILWGFGTVLGNLPLYFNTKAAGIVSGYLIEFQQIIAASRKEIEVLEYIESDKSIDLFKFVENNDNDFISIAKRAILNNLQKQGFITVLLCASIPNHLFDYVSTTCGKIGMPFLTFFSATVIGKSIIKVHIQIVFVVFYANSIINVFLFLESYISCFQGKLTAYFLLVFINSFVKGYYSNLKTEEEEEMKIKNKKNN